MRDTPSRPKPLPLSRRRSFVTRHTRLRAVEGVPGIRLHLADEVEPVWHASEALLGPNPPIPFWAFAWAGGLALARHLLARPAEVGGLRVLDFGSGSGLVAIAAALGGAAHVSAADIDPFADAAVRLNARANGVHVSSIRADLLEEPPPDDIDLLVAADTWYEGPLAERVLPWLRAAALAGTRVLVADPGRKYLPPPDESGMQVLGIHEVHTTTTLEDRAVVASTVYALTASPPR
jgi:predicted nicotinamide N-methyase